MPPALPQVWIITDPNDARGPVAAIAEALADCPAGRVGVQLRAKGASGRQLEAWGHHLREVTTASANPFVVNGRIDIALIVKADGVHLPENGIPAPRIRRTWPQLSLIGESKHDADGLMAAGRDEAIYAFLSPVFDVPEKGTPMGVDDFRSARTRVALPVFALGGIKPDNVAALAAAGAAGVAVQRAVYNAQDPAKVVRDLLDEFDKGAANVE